MQGLFDQWEVLTVACDGQLRLRRCITVTTAQHLIERVGNGTEQFKNVNGCCILRTAR